MNNLFSAGLLAISIIVLNGCKESVDLTSVTHHSSTTTQTASDTNTSGTQNHVTDTTQTDTKDTESENNSGSSETNQTTDSETTNDETNENTVTTTANCEVEATSITSFVRVELHYGLMSDAPFINGELQGLDSLTVTEDAAQNSKVLKLSSTIGLKPGQLITYVGINGHNRVAEIGAISSNQVTITSGLGLETAILAGSSISNFYNDATHPNANGYKAIADFGIRHSYPIAPNQKHVLLGDSWFDKSESSSTTEFKNQLETRLPGSTIVNAGVGGNTLCDLINRFDTDVASESPQYVWINSSINDYYNDVSAADFKARMKFLIGRVESLGATAIVFDSAPATGTSFGGDNLTVLSRRYATAVLELFNETQTPQ